MTNSGLKASRRELARWYLSSVALSVPQAAGAVGFSLIALKITDDARGGAAMILAMTLSQIIGALPIARATKLISSHSLLRILFVVRAIALLFTTTCIYFNLPFGWILVGASGAGVVNGAAYGHLRALLNNFVSESDLPKALGLASTFNEVTFAIAPVLVSLVGGWPPAVLMFFITVMSSIPALVALPEGRHPVERSSNLSDSSSSVVFFLWLGCAAIGASSVAAIEIGAVSLAIRLGLQPTSAIVFTIPLCLSSILGGIWVSWRNRRSTHRGILYQLIVLASGSALIASTTTLAGAILGAAIVGIVLAPLSTQLTLAIEDLTPTHRRIEAFALLRTANAIGVICASAMLTVFSVSLSLASIALLMFAMCVTALFLPLPRRAED